MLTRRKLFLWLGLVVSLLAAGYGGAVFAFYVGLSAAAPAHWLSTRTALWAYGALASALLFFGIFVYCVTSLIKKADR